MGLVELQLGQLPCLHRRCFWQTLEPIIALVVIGILVVLYTTGAFPTGVVLTNILLAAIFAPLFVRIICCAWE